jgi:hypothetical protein
MLRKLVTAQLIVLSMGLSFNASAADEDFQTTDDELQGLVDVDTMDAEQNKLFEERPDLPGIIRRFQVVCYAGSGRGVRFQARGWFPRQVQREAIERCERSTRWGRCYAMGCRRFAWR